MGLTLMEGHLIEQVLLICKFAQNIGGWGKLPTCPSGSSGPAGHLLTFFFKFSKFPIVKVTSNGRLSKQYDEKNEKILLRMKDFIANLKIV